MNPSVLSSLLPVMALIGIGFVAGRRGWMSAAGAKDLSNLVFTVLTPALLFRTMSSVRVEQLDFAPVASYFAGVAVIFFGTLLTLGFNRRGAVLGLAGTYSNNVMIGIPLVALAYGSAGLVALFTLVSVHALVLLTAATIVLELAVLHEERKSGIAGTRRVAHTVALAMRNGIVHPVPLPIIAGLLFARTGLSLPEVIDKPLQLLSAAFGPMALLLVGVTLAASRIGASWRGALALSFVKNFVHPVLVAGIGAWMGLRGVQLAVMVVAAALPIGANVFMFSQRYEVAQDEVTAAVAISTVLSLPSLLAVIWLLGR